MPNPVPRTIRVLAKHGAQALKPSFASNGYFQGPMVKARVAANLRKRSLIEGTFGTFDATKGGWNPEWDEPRKFHFLRPFRGHMRDRNRDERAAKITKALESVDEKISKYRKEVQSRKPVKDIVFMFKRVANISRDQERRRKGPIRIKHRPKKRRSADEMDEMYLAEGADEE